MALLFLVSIASKDFRAKETKTKNKTHFQMRLPKLWQYVECIIRQNKNRPSAGTLGRLTYLRRDATYCKHIVSFPETACKRNFCSALAVIFIPIFKKRRRYYAYCKKTAFWFVEVPGIQPL